MTGNLIKDMVLLSKGIMILEPEITEHPLGLDACSGNCNACNKCDGGDDHDL